MPLWAPRRHDQYYAVLQLSQPAVRFRLKVCQSDTPTEVGRWCLRNGLSTEKTEQGHKLPGAHNGHHAKPFLHSFVLLHP